MLNSRKITITITFFILFVVASYGQSTEVMDKLKSKSDEILLVKVTNDSSFFLMENFKCFSSAYCDVIENFKRTKIQADRKKVIVLHGAKCDNKGFPHKMKLKVGKLYFVFLSTDKITQESVLKDVDNNDQFTLSDYYLGILEFNEELYKYLKL